MKQLARALLIFSIALCIKKPVEASPIESFHKVFKGVKMRSQASAIYQTSNLDLKVGDLKHADGSDLTQQELQALDHKDGAGSYSATIMIEKKLNKNNALFLDLQFANGEGVDSTLQGGAMVNNDVMEDANNPNKIYVAKAFYETKIAISDHYNLTFDIGKMGVNDFFDVGDENSDQSIQFLNQAIANNGAFDYVQDLDGHGYTYGSRVGVANNVFGVDVGFFSSDAHLENIHQKYSLLGAITLTPKFGDFEGKYQFYVFSNRGEYAAFDANGALLTHNADAINSVNNADHLNKNGFGLSFTQAVLNHVNIFAKYGQQDDDRDVRHYQDMDESYMLGANFSGELWSHYPDQIGIAYEIGKLTGNHRKAHEKGYAGLFDRSAGVGVNNYADEHVMELYYKFGFQHNTSFTVDFQNISNFYYSQKIGSVQLIAGRLTTLF